MKLLLSVCLISLVSLGLSSCSDGPVASSKSRQLPSTETLNQQQEERYLGAQKPIFVPWTKFDESLESFQLSCEDCPPSFGQMISQTTKPDPDSPETRSLITTSNCQGGLIDKDLFLSSRHCLPEDLSEVGKSCEGRIKIILPEISDEHSVQVIECDQIQSLSDEFPSLSIKTPKPDWVILKLKTSTENRWQEMDTDGLADNEKFYSYIPLENPDTGEVKIATITCTSRQKTLGLPDFTENKSPIALLECDRDITKGFSGLLLYRGAGAAAKPTSVLSHIWNAQINQENIIVDKTIVASNLACQPVDDHEILGSCEFHAGKREHLKEQLIIAALKAEKIKIDHELKDFLADDSRPVQWQAVNFENLTDLPASYAHYLEMLQDVRNSYVTKPQRKFFFQAMIPVFAQCLKKDFAPDPNQDKQTFTTIPVITLIVSKTAQRRVEVRHNLEMLPVEIFHSRSQEGHFIFKETTPLSAHNRPANFILAERFSHLSTQMSICP